MKTVITLTCLILLGYSSIAQNIQFDYDAGGNRILRKPENGLPVTLISFTATKSDNSTDMQVSAIALLYWQTSEEVNFDHFTIQRSQDGKRWVDIGRIRSQGESTPEISTLSGKISNTYYTFVDNAPAEGENLFRLKMIDKDGSFAHSQIRALYFEPSVLAYPNPVSHVLTLNWRGLQNCPNI